MTLKTKSSLLNKYLFFLQYFYLIQSFLVLWNSEIKIIRQNMLRKTFFSTKHLLEWETLKEKNEICQSNQETR